MAQLTIRDIMSVPLETTSPEGTTIGDVMNPARDQAPDPLAGTSAVQRALIGAGRRFVDLGRGAQLLAGRAGLMSPARTQRVQQLVDESAAINRPLDQDIAASLGSVATDIALGGGLAGAGATAARMGARRLGRHLSGSTYRGAAATGAGLGAIEPTTTGNEGDVLSNAAIGAVGGTAGLAIGNVVGRGVNAARGRFSQNASAKALDDAARAAGVDLSLPAVVGPAGRDPVTGQIRATISPTVESVASLVDPFMFVRRGRDKEAAQVAELMSNVRKSGPEDAKRFVEGIVRQFNTVEAGVNRAYDLLRQEVVDKRFQTTPVVADATREALQGLYRSFPQVLSKKAALVPEEARVVMGRLLGDVRDDLSGFLERYGDQLSEGTRKRLENKVDGDKIVTVQQLQRLMSSLPQNLQDHLTTALSADRRTLSFDEITDLRKAMGGILGQLSKQEATGTASPLALRGMKRVYGSIIRDVENWGGEALNASVMAKFREANDLYRDSLLPFFALPKFRQVLDSAEPDATTGQIAFDWTKYDPDNIVRDFMKKGRPELVAGLFDFSDEAGRAAGVRVLEDAAAGLQPPTESMAAGRAMTRSNVPPTPAALDSAAQGYEDALAAASPEALGRATTLSNIFRAAQPAGSSPFDAFPLVLGAVAPGVAYMADSLSNEDKDPAWDTAAYTLGALGALGLAGRSLRTRPVKSLALADQPLYWSGSGALPGASSALSVFSQDEQ